MKKILITGEESFVGTSFEKYLKDNFPTKYKVDTISVRGNTWQKEDFSGYDTVFHVAGLAHVDVKKVDEETKKKYYKINSELTEKVAKKAKKDGVKQFIFMSSAIVYGDSAKIGEKREIKKNAPVNPANFYGDSKVQAEKKILPLNDKNFKVCILRPPMIYGKGCKGNFKTLEKFAKKFPFFPNIKNERSMLYVENLAEFVRLMMENKESGIFHPANKEISQTSKIVKEIAKINGKDIRLIKNFSGPLKISSRFTGLINKAFGNFTYSEELTKYKENYQLVSLKESIKRTCK